MRSKSVAAAIAVAATLAVPTGASAHPFTVAGGAFSGEFPTIDLEGGLIAGRSDFEGGTPPGDYTTSNMRFLGFSPRPAGLATANSDIAFQGNLAYQGTFRGFRVVDIRKPAAPQEVINYEDCRGSQGDVIVYKDILARSWDVRAGNSATCDGQPVPPGWEGLHIFDISDPTNPELLAQVRTRCGSHTASAVPDQRNQRLLIYNTPSYSATNCTVDPPAAGIQVVEVPLGSPEDSRALQFEDAGPTIRCHDTGVYLGTKSRRAACAGGNGIAVWSMDAEDGGSLEDPALLYARDLFATETSDFRIGHSAAFSNDGDTLIIGHEPGGGVRARCQRTGAPLDGSDGYTIQTNEMKSFYFLDANNAGATLAKWTLPRDQTATENCTLHNYNVVPTKKRDVLVQGSYQSGIGVLDFTDLQNIREVGFADPKPLNPTALAIGGDWSSHWYNGFVFESDITRGLLSWQYLGDEFRAATHLNRLNPQTQVVTDG